MLKYIIEARVNGNLTRKEITTNAAPMAAKQMFIDQCGGAKVEAISILSQTQVK